jgi:arsenic resistance protein ArsH
MRIFVIPNQLSIPKAYTQFTDPTNSATGEVDVAAEGGSRLRPSGNRDRIVDCIEELVKYTLIMRYYFDLFNDRFSERAER